MLLFACFSFTFRWCPGTKMTSTYSRAPHSDARRSYSSPHGKSAYLFTGTPHHRTARQPANTHGEEVTRKKMNICARGQQQGICSGTSRLHGRGRLHARRHARGRRRCRTIGPIPLRLLARLGYGHWHSASLWSLFDNKRVGSLFCNYLFIAMLFPFTVRPATNSSFSGLPRSKEQLLNFPKK